MKRAVSLLVVLAMIVTTFTGWSLVAASPENAFIATFDKAFTGSLGATSPVTSAFSYENGDEARAHGWFGGVFDKDSTLVYTINDGAEAAIPMNPAEEGVVAAIKAAYADATFFTRFDVDMTAALGEAHTAGGRSAIRMYVKNPDGSKFLFATFTAKAPEAPFESDDTYAYKLADSSITLQNCVQVTPSENYDYISVVTQKGDPQDPYFGITGLSIPSEYKYMAVKYAGASNTSIGGNNHYVATANLAFGQPGSHVAPEMVCDDTWRLKIYDVTTCFTGVGEDDITMVRLLPGSVIGKEVRFAYVAFFKTEADAQAYDAEYCERYTLENMTPPPREEVIPDALESAPEYTFSFTDLEVGYDIAGTSFADGNPFRKMWTPMAGTPTSSIKVATDNSAAFLSFTQATFDDRWKGGSEISLTLKAESNGANFAGFYVRSGEEGSTPLFENDGARTDGQESTTGTTGVGFSFRTRNGKDGVEIFVKYLDGDGKLKVKGSFFELQTKDAFHTYKVVDDDAGTMSFYADNVLFAKVTYTNAKMTESAQYSEKYYSNAQILNAAGTVLETVENAVISTQSTVGIGGRAENFYVKDIEIAPLAAPVPDKTISTNKTTYAVGEPIKITYSGAVRDNADWLCIYEGASSSYGEPGGPTSIQYAYIGEDGIVIFNDIHQAVTGNDRTALHSSLDALFNETDKIFYQGQDSSSEGLACLRPGTYHAIILGGGSWYDIECEKIVFEVVEGPINVVSADEICQAGDYKLVNDITGNITINAGEYTIDLNGYTINGQIQINGGTVCINDSSADKTGTITSDVGDVIELPTGSTADVTLDGITVIGNAAGCDGVFVRAGKVTVNDCTITAISSAIQNRTSAGEIIINGGLYYSANNALKVNDGATITINSGVFAGAFQVGDGREPAAAFLTKVAPVTEEIEIEGLGTVTATVYYLFGDLNDDGIVEGADCSLLLQYLAEWDVAINTALADVNCDDEINGKDATLLLQYLADWDVVLGPQA